MAKRAGNKKADKTPTFFNRKAKHDYEILETIEVGIVLEGTEVKALRDGDCSIAEGYVLVKDEPPALTLHDVMIGPYPPAGALQHVPTRHRQLIAHKREIRKLARDVDQKGVTIVPLKLYFKGSFAKLQIGVAKGRQQHDKRRAIADRESKRELDRAMSKYRG